jgi:membrane-bound metal-dependent hydrolase YbcI (DUF457 family)
MASIIGHGFAGIITKQIIKTKLSYKKERLLLWICLFLAVLPDFDIIIYILFKPSGMLPHRGFSHGLPFILITSIFFTLLSAQYFGILKRKLFLIYFLSLFSHSALDYLMGAGPPIAFFAPFSNISFLSPVSFIPWAYYSKSAKGLLQILFYPPAILGYCLELMIFIPVVQILKKPNVRMFNYALLAIFSFGLIYTISIYN